MPNSGENNKILKCCQSNDSLVSISSETGTVCETVNNYVIAPTVMGANKNFNNNNELKMHNKQAIVHTFPKQQAVDLEFEDVSFSTTTFSMSKYRFEKKKILHGVSGKFNSGELSVIMGPSGAGKSTLLNILAGFTTRGSTGTVKLNGTVRDQSPRFRKFSAYIPQDEELRLALTALEAMTFAANLKLGYGVSQEYKMTEVVEILELLGLEKCHHTLTCRLSGGQRKRLAVALELLNNPSILFLDEPTTGLDSASCSSCVALFSRLAQEGRTIVCTIHQPSALLFEMFDKLYALADGKCIYEGTTGNLVPYLSKFNLNCPAYHNPADYLMEVAIGEHGTDLNALADAAKILQAELKIESPKEIELKALTRQNTEMALLARQNTNPNLLVRQNTSPALALLTRQNTNPAIAILTRQNTNPSISILTRRNTNLSILSRQNTNQSLFEEKINKVEEHIVTPVAAAMFMQFYLLFKRNLLTTRRCYLYPLNRLLAHIIIGFIFGYLYKGVGNNASKILANYVYIYGTLLLNVYTGKMSVTILFPFEMKILAREHFNRWYKLTPYLFSVILVEIPFQLTCTWIYIAISYWLTSQPFDFRMYLFVVFCTLATLCGQSMGYFLGATTPTKIAVFLGPVFACLFSIFGFCIRHYDTPNMFRWLFNISYFRAAFQSAVYAIYGLDRGNLPCPETEVYCHYEVPAKFLREMDITDVDLVSNVILIVFITCLMHAATYLTLWLKLNKR